MPCKKTENNDTREVQGRRGALSTIAVGGRSTSTGLVLLDLCFIESAQLLRLWTGCELLFRPMTTLERLDNRRKLPHLQHGTRPLFVTMATRRRWVLRPAARSIVLEHIVRQHRSKILLAAAVVMPDHAHLLFSPMEVAPEQPFSLPKIMHAIRGPSAHDVNHCLQRHGSVWEEEFFDRLLREGEFDATVSYICINPVRRKIVDDETKYPWLWLCPELGGDFEA